MAAVVLAAGLSRRMGREKVLLPFGRSSVLETVLETLAASGVSEVVVVTRPDLPEAARRARRLGAAVVENPHPEGEMIVSIRLGLEAVASEAEAVFVWPADHPAVERGTLGLLQAGGGHAVAAVPRRGASRGHPVLLGRDLLPAVERLPEGSGLKQLWRERPEILREVAVDDEGVLLDINTPESYRAALDRPCRR